MKIGRHKVPGKDSWRYEVSGPNIGRMPAPTLGFAVSLAQGRACKHDEEGTWYVREYDDVVVRIERDEKGVITTRAA